MSRIRSRDTRPELIVRRLLHAQGLRYRTHVVGVPGRPDSSSAEQELSCSSTAIFGMGGNSRTGRRCSAPTGARRSSATCAATPDNFDELERQGWTVIRLWEHEIEADAHGCAERVVCAVQTR